MSYNFDPDDEWTSTNPYRDDAVRGEPAPALVRALRCLCGRWHQPPASAAAPARAQQPAAPAPEPAPVEHPTYEEFLVFITRILRRFPEVYRTVAGELRDTWPKPVLLAT